MPIPGKVERNNSAGQPGGAPHVENESVGDEDEFEIVGSESSSFFSSESAVELLGG